MRKNRTRTIRKEIKNPFPTVSSVQLMIVGAASPRAPPLALPSARSGLAGGPTEAGSADNLPAVAGADAWIVAARDVGSAMTFDDIEPSVGFVGVEGAADDRYEAVAAVATGSCEQNPISMTGFFAGVFACLPDAAVVGDDIAAVGNSVRVPGFDDW